MIETGFDARVKVQQIVENQLPEFILDESPKSSEFLKQYYISQEYQGGAVDIAENLDQYLKLDNLIPEVVVGITSLSADLSSTSGIVSVTSTKGYPNQYGLLKIDDEIITYTGITANTFTGCIRGFSGITSYHAPNDQEELVFSQTNTSTHTEGSKVENLSSLFLKEFYKKIKYTFTPGLEDKDFIPELKVGNFIKQARDFYKSKGTDQSFRILFNILYGVNPKVIDLEQFLIKPSSSVFVRRQLVVAERISGDPNKLAGQTIRKSTDYGTNASVSEVEILTRKNKVYYKLALYVGFDQNTQIQGDFNISPKTKVVENVSQGSSVITVDSTIGFTTSGTVISGNNVISYSDKTINQFLGCSNVEYEITTADDIRSDEIYYGFEDNDLTKKVEIRITGVISDFTNLNDFGLSIEGEEMKVSHLGKIIKNPESNKTYTETVANSFIYNTSSRYYVNYSSGSFNTNSTIDKSSLIAGDSIEVLIRGSQTVVSSPVTIATIASISGNTINVTNLLDLNDETFDPTNSSKVYFGRDLDIRRKVKKATSSGTSLDYGNNTLLSDVQNVYDDNNGNLYVASNSLPSYNITQNIFEIDIPTANSTYLQDKNNSTQKYSTISFDFSTSSSNGSKGFTQVPFLTGDKVFYSPQDIPITGLEKGFYYVEVVSQTNIRLYASQSFIVTGDYIPLDIPLNANGSHSFTLADQRTKNISAQKLLRKIPVTGLNPTDSGNVTTSGPIGILINGVEIQNYKSSDKIYYGPLESVNILNGGTDYDVVNPPALTVESGVGVTALVNPVIVGSIQKIFIDPQDFDLDVVVSIAVSGGNGIGGVFEPILEKRRRSIYFDARDTDNSGGIDLINETITFKTNHNLANRDAIIYSANGNSQIGIATFGGSNASSGSYLRDGTIYYTKVVNSKTIQLYNSLSDFNSGINTVGFTTINTYGLQKFQTFALKNTLSQIKIVDGGSGYSNRKVIVNPTGISTFDHTINFTNHGFNSGDFVTYTYDTTTISGLSSSNQYKVLKVDTNTFRLANAGIGGTYPSDYQRGKYVKFSSSGSGYQYFSYPQISATINYSVGINSSSVGIITATPIIRGTIVDAYIYEAGTNYGSTILNFHKRPKISINNGTGAELVPVIIGDTIQSVQIKYGGKNYYSIPDLNVIGDGSGAILRPSILNGKIVKVFVQNGGQNYTSENTFIDIAPAGKDAVIEASVRSLTLNNNYRFNNSEIISGQDSLEYSVGGYISQVRSAVNDNSQSTNAHSPLIGWAYDGNPIYGSYGYPDPTIVSDCTILRPGYSLNSSNIFNRPSLTNFPAGSLVEDYVFNNSGDLDYSNGRFGKTPEFPLGTYAYFAGITTGSTQVLPSFPYFVGNRFKNNFIEENRTLTQSFDFNNSSLIRNTLPYKINDEYADNDFIVESNEIINQKVMVDSIHKGKIEAFDVLNSGNGYSIGDTLVVDNTGTYGSNVDAKVFSLTGKDIVNVNTTIETYDNTIFTRKDGNSINATILPYHTFSDGDNVTVSGFSTYLSALNGSYPIGVTSYSTTLINAMASSPSVGLVTDIYVANVPPNISIGSSISVGIGSEILSIIYVFDTNNIIRVKRSSVGVAYSASTIINYLPDTLTINKKTEYFDSTLNNKIFFNPAETVGLGTLVGIGTTVRYKLNGQNYIGIGSTGLSPLLRTVPTQSIYIKNHPFKDNQQVLFKKPVGIAATALIVSGVTTTFTLPSPGDAQIVYVTNKSRDTIGIKTQLTSSEIFFIQNGTDNYEYSIESVFPQLTARIDKIKSTVSVSTAHGLLQNDTIKLSVQPNLSVGIGTSSSIYVSYYAAKKQLIFNPIGFTSVGINTINNTINLPNHNLNTGDKVFYKADDLAASGLTTGGYFVYRVNNDNIQLSETYNDSILNPPTVVNTGIVTGGRYQQIGLINPEIKSIKGNNLVFNLSDATLSGYNFKLYTDNQFKNEFVSIAGTTTLSVIGIGSLGTASATKTIQYNSKLPRTLFYTLEKSGYLSTSDKDVNNYSQITFIDSTYNGNYSITGVGTTTFSFSLQSIPERKIYNASDCSSLKYTTKSNNATGGVDKVRIISGGYNYKKLPKVSYIDSQYGSSAYVVPTSSTIGKINDVKIINQGFEYASDKTLRPSASIPSYLIIDSSNTLTGINVDYGGNYYSFAPSVVAINPNTGKEVVDYVLNASLKGYSIGKIDIVKSPKGLPATPIQLFTVNNSNGISVDTIVTSQAGIATCTLVTPVLGFSTSVFGIGDKVFVEGIQQSGTTGTGYNSADYGYKFFTVTNYQNTIPATVEFSVSQYSSNPGIAKTIQDSFGNIVKYRDYPQFTISQEASKFILGEKLASATGSVFTERDLIVTEYNTDSIKASGSYSLAQGERIKGIISGSVATISSVISREGRFETDYSTKNNYDWIDQVGRLNEDVQVVNDSNYYQNLSYTIKSPIQYEELKTSVNSLLHTTGLKNFADTQVQSVARSGISSVDGTTIIYDIQSENRVDTINSFDLAIDINVSNNRSKFLKLKNKKLSSYIECRTNRVLQVDDVSTQFTNNDAAAVGYADLITYSLPDNFGTYLVQIINTPKSRYQFTDLVVLVDNNYNVFTLQRQSLNNSTIKVADIDGYIDDALRTISLRFTPLDRFNEDYDIKMIKSSFPGASIGIGSTSVGFINLTNSGSYISSGVTTSLVSVATTTNCNSFYGTFQIIDDVTNYMDFVELYMTYDGQDTYTTQYYYDTSSLSNNYSGNFIGTFGASVSSGVLSINYTNDTSNLVTVNSKIVGFGTTSIGIGTYRFLVPGQGSGFERSAKYESLYSRVSTASTIISYSITDVGCFKAKVNLSVGSTSELHQIMFMSDGVDAYITQYPVLSNNDTAGIGTFGTVYSPLYNRLFFYPNSSLGGATVEVKIYNEVFYIESDYNNVPPNLVYGTGEDEFTITPYNGLNARRINKLDFDMNYQGIPIYTKTFDPSNGVQLNPSTGVITIPNHFFNTAEELIYNPATTFLGIAVTAVGIGSTLSYTGVVTSFLPPRVYPIKLDNNNFQLATRKEYAQSGIYVTFTSLGSGNSHELEMTKKLEKSLITIDSVVQAPLAYSLLDYTLKYNSDLIGISKTGIIGVSTNLITGINTSGIVVGKLIGSVGIVSSGAQVTSIGIGSLTINKTSLQGISTTTTFNFDGGIGAGNTNFSISGISSIKPTDLLKIDNEYVRVVSVGLGTTSGAPISGLGTYYILNIQRGYAGTIATAHFNDTAIPLYRGSYNIVGNKLWFTESPRGNAVTKRDISNLEQAKSSFTGRVYLRKDYTTNTLYDNISEKFTGIGQTYILTLNGMNTTGIGSTGGNGILFINSIFQTPSTKNNTGNNFTIVDNAVLGITSAVFSGITSTNGQIIKSDADVNQNQLPRGGIIVSLGTSEGSGYAPLVGVGSTGIEIKLSGGSISSIGFTTSFIVGVAVTGLIGITTNIITGITTNSISVGQQLQAIGVVTTGTYVTSIGFGTIFINSNSTNAVGIATTFRFRSEPNFGSGYFGTVSIGISDPTGSGAVVSGRVGSGGSISGFIIQNGGSGYTNPYAQVAPPSYENLSIIGVSRLSLGSTTDTGVGLQMNVTVGPNASGLTIISNRNADASNLILSNKQLIAEVAVGRMLAAYPTFVIPGGNQNCVEDVVTVLECIAYNLKYGGNSRVYDAAKIYIDNQYLAGEEAQSIYAFAQARDMAIQAMTNQPITIGGYSSQSQYFDYTIIADPLTGFNTSPASCADVASAITQFVGIVTYAIGTNTLPVTKTGVASTLFDVQSFKITRPGYGFQIGDVFKPVGLVTAKGLSAPVKEFKLTVLSTFSDSFAAWQFGEMDYIDSIKAMQDGSRTRFPLYYNSQLLSFEINTNDQDSANIDLGPILLIFVNGIVQAHGDTYEFDGGSSFVFKYPPLPEDNIAIFFYRGTRNQDSTLVAVNETIKRGDSVQLFKNPIVSGITTTQNSRLVSYISASDKLETNIYADQGIDVANYKPFSWTKQKVDSKINGEIVRKTRDSIEGSVYPSARIIRDLTSFDTELFVDDANFFKYEQNQTAAYSGSLSPITIGSFGALIVSGKDDPVSAALTATVSAAGTISALTITNAGSGYTGTTIPVKIARPRVIGVGIGSTATAIVNISNGSISSPTITNPGYGYTTPPQVIVAYPSPIIEKIGGASLVQGFSGIITGIGTTTGTSGNPLALRFYLNVNSPNSFPSGLTTGYPIYISDTVVGGALTSINNGDNAVVGVGTTYVNNIYYIHSLSYVSVGSTNAEIVCNIKSNTSVVGLSTGGNKFAGRFSWGRISGFSRSSNPISIGVSGYTITSGLTTFASIQRRGYGLRDIGPLKKDLG